MMVDALPMCWSGRAKRDDQHPVQCVPSSRALLQMHDPGAVMAGRARRTVTTTVRVVDAVWGIESAAVVSETKGGDGDDMAYLAQS